MGDAALHGGSAPPTPNITKLLFAELDAHNFRRDLEKMLDYTSRWFRTEADSPEMNGFGLLVSVAVNPA